MNEGGPPGRYAFSASPLVLPHALSGTSPDNASAMILALLLALQGSAGPVPGPPPGQASVVLVRAQHGPAGQGRQGSGVVVAPGLVATNAHVVEGGRELAVVQGTRQWSVTQVRVDVARDLCLMAVPGLPLPAAEPAPEPQGPGQAVFSVGYPGGRGPEVAEGRLLGIWYHGQGRLLQSDAPTHPGSSGGGLFDAEGRLLGLTTFTYTQNARLNFSVPVDWIRDLVAQAPQPVVPGRRSSLAPASADFLKDLADDPRNWPAWETMARRWVAMNEADPEAWMALGLALDRLARRHAERGEGAPMALLVEAVQAHDRSVRLRPHTRAWNNLGVSLEAMNRFDEAERAFQEALRLDAGNAAAWLNLGVARSNAGRFKEAAEALRRGLALRPDEGLAWARLARALRRSAAWEAAVEALTIAIRYRPLSEDLWLEMGLLQARLRHLEEAEAILARLRAVESPLADRLEQALRRLKARRPPQVSE